MSSFDESFDEAKQRRRDILEAVELYRCDPRFRMIIDSSVAEARRELGPVDTTGLFGVDRYAHELAIQTAALALAQVLHKDSELAATRAERDAYKKLANRAVELMPVPMLVIEPRIGGDPE